jgi:hypothetical protein
MQAADGQEMSLEQALNSLTDVNGNKIDFEKQEDGSYSAAGTSTDRYTYTVSLTPEPVKVYVSVSKELKGTKKAVSKPRPATPQEEKEAEKYNKTISSKHK